MQETDPLFLHPSLTTLNYDTCKTKDPAGEGEILQPADTGEILQMKPASDFSPSNRSCSYVQLNTQSSCDVKLNTQSSCNIL